MAVFLTFDDLRALGTRLLIRRGAAPATANCVVESLLRAERLGYSSHGLLRLCDYVQAIDDGTLDPAALPESERLSAAVWRVDGRHGFGQRAVETVAALLADGDPGQVRVVSLVNAGHIGRLADVVAVAALDALVMGCCNYMGFGQRVVPPGGRDGRLCTNPLVLAVPCPGGAPIVLDMTTSHVSEGKVREQWMAGRAVPAGWLLDADGDVVTDPSALYAVPPRAAMAPLGAEMGHKGFGLALFVEILAGVLTGAGFCGAPAANPGNAGVFARIPLDILGIKTDTALAGIGRLVAEMCASGPDVRLPGGREPAASKGLEISRLLFEILSEAGPGIA